jgi:hypothetical protein
MVRRDRQTYRSTAAVANEWPTVPSIRTLPDRPVSVNPQFDGFLSTCAAQ